MGKSIGEYPWSEYKAFLKRIVPKDVLIDCNSSIGHALPRCIIPFGVKASVSMNEQKITFDW